MSSMWCPAWDLPRACPSLHSLLRFPAELRSLLAKECCRQVGRTLRVQPGVSLGKELFSTPAHLPFITFDVCSINLGTDSGGLEEEVSSQKEANPRGHPSSVFLLRQDFTQLRMAFS